MGKTLAEKILGNKSGTDSRAGEIVIAEVNLAFVQDTTGPLTVRQFQKPGFKKLADSVKAALFLDHASGIHADGVLKDPDNYELYGFEELGRGEPEFVETGREICTGRYGGIRGFRHVMDEIMGKSALTFKSTEESEKVLELVRYANVASQKPLVEDELLFIAQYPDIAKKILTMNPLDY